MTTIPYLIGSKQFAQNLHMHNLASELSSAVAKGHKRTRMTFNAVEVPFQQKDPGGLKSSFYPIQGYQWKDRRQGGVEKTNNPLHVAIQGQGFFEMEDQTYTRDGELFLDAEGVLTNSDGLAFSDLGGSAIQIPPNTVALRFQPNGQILDQNDQLLGQLRIVEFENVDHLKNAGHNRYRTDDLPLETTRSSLMQGYLEQSNVEISPTLVEAHSTKTDYQMLGAMLRKHDELQQQLTHQLLHVQV